MRMRRAHQLQVQQALDRHIEREARLAGDDIRSGGRGHVMSDAAAGLAVLGARTPSMASSMAR